MPESTSASRRIRFSDFEADLHSRELFKDGALVRLPNQSFLALAALLERPGELVTREELRSRLWPDNRVVEFEQGLNAIINRLREALGDSADTPRFIETLPRRGYRFVGELAALAPALTPHPSPSAPAIAIAPSPSLRTRIAAGIAIVMLSLGITVTAFRTLPRSPAPPASAGNALTVTPLTTLLGQEHMPALAPDGQRLAFAWDGESGASAGFDLFVRTLDSERLTRLTHTPAQAVAPAWSPDGSRIAFSRMGDKAGLYSIAATGGAEMKLADARFTQESLMRPAWSPDGKTLAFSAMNADGSHAVRLMPIPGSSSQPLTDAPACWHAGAPSFSPDGSSIAFLCMTSVAIYGVYVAAVDGAANTRPRELARFQGLPQGIAWRDSRRILVANDSGDGSGVWALALDGTRSRPTVAEDALAAGVSAGNGRAVYSRARLAIDIWRIAPGASAPARRWIFSTRSQMTPQFSPDGRQIAFQSNRSGNPEIWLADAEGSNAVRLTDFNGPLTGGPSWCADGRRLAFDSRASGVSAIYVIDVQERVARRVDTPQTNLALPVWSADCRWLLASDGREALYRVPAGGGEARRFTPLRSYQAAIVGDRVIFNAIESANVSLWTQPLEGGDAVALPGMPRLAYADSWAANRQSLFFTDSSAEPVALRRYDFASHEIREIARLPNKPTPLGGLGLAVSADGESILYTHTEDLQSDLVLATFD
jgi:Tol biopolymer transport system component/DNA-binding winged helix-turn-helix (wHTH) protein